MPRVLIWDLPVRFSHWLLAGGVLLAFGIAKLTGKHGDVFPFHAIIGLTLGALLVLRLAWGVCGTRYARFSSLQLRPAAVWHYLIGVMSGRPGQHVGHNPANSWAIVLIYCCVAAVVGSGAMMSQGIEVAEELHEAAAYVLIAIALVHVAGVLVHTLQARANITLGMITGRKQAEPHEAIRSAAIGPAIVMLVLVAAMGGTLLKNYNPSTKQTTLPGIGTPITLAEVEGTSHKSHRHHDDD
jgi:cytochrome b